MRNYLIVVLIIAFVGCRKSNNYSEKKLVNYDVEILKKAKNKPSCDIIKNKDSVEIIFNSISRKFLLDDIETNDPDYSDVKINCKGLNYIIESTFRFANTYQLTQYIFNEKLQLSNIYIISSDRNVFEISAMSTSKSIKFIEFDPSLNYKVNQVYKIDKLQETKTSSISLFFELVKTSFEKNNYSKLKLYSNDIVISSILRETGINNKNLSQFNDIAYYFEQSKAYTEAVFLLEKIIQKFPNRTVAYINLGDAYWGNKEKEKAIIAYKKYVNQMKKLGKEKKIPKQVLEKIKN